MKETVLITGGTSGIGLELTRLFAKDGYRVVILARDTGELSATADQLKNESAAEVVTLQKDLFHTEGARQVYDAWRLPHYL